MIYCASLSYGKDSMAMLHVVKDILHLPLDRIITAEVWATDTIQADLPPMVEFKDKADAEIQKRWGIKVEHFYAMKNGEKMTYEKQFYTKMNRSKIQGRNGTIYGFPRVKGGWCVSNLKLSALNAATRMEKNTVHYVGIASDETNRIERHKDKKNTRLPLVEAGWTERMCLEWCEKNDLLSPIYTTATRGGCWFCHNQSIVQLRKLRKNYPNLWSMLLKWDCDSMYAFKADGHTVHDYDRRFRWEDEGYKPIQNRFSWGDVNYPQMNIEQILNGYNK